MGFTLEQVVPWGRSFDEYRVMFDLTDADLNLRILGCSDGPAAFNAALTKQGGRVVSVDPLYAFSREEISRQIEETFETVLEQTRQNEREFVWRHIRSIEELGEIRRAAMQEFLADYETGVEAQRYVNAGLPRLPFADQEFDLALCSHFLFLYSAHFSADFHLESIKELCRVAREVRIFPLLELGTQKSRYLDLVLKHLKSGSYEVEIRRVSYEFQKQGNEMLCVSGF